MPLSLFPRFHHVLIDLIGLGEILLDRFQRPGACCFGRNDFSKDLLAVALPILSKRKPSNRFVMHPSKKVGAFSDYGILLIFDAAGIGDRATPEYCIFLGVFAVSH